MNIHRPVLLLDKDKCENNMARMLLRAKKNGCRLEPHFKTHQSAEIGRWFSDLGIEAITVSSLKMAEYFARHGWKNITVAFPVNPDEIELINSLSEKIHLTVLISCTETVSKISLGINHKTFFLIEIDNGYHRSGIDPDDLETIENIIDLTRDTHLKFKGFHCHSGNTYQAGNEEEIVRIGKETIEKLSGLKIIFSALKPEMEISCGDTPSCSLIDSFEGIDIIRPGNFIFYDLQQLRLGVCQWSDIAVALACPVVAVYPERKEAVIYGGAVHLSKDYAVNPDGSKNFGAVCRFNGRGWDEPIKDVYVKLVSQEHGIISFPENQSFEVGEILCILPAHSCLTADCMRQYMTTDSKIIEMMPKV